MLIFLFNLKFTVSLSETTFWTFEKSCIPYIDHKKKKLCLLSWINYDTLKKGWREPQSVTARRQFWEYVTENSVQSDATLYSI